MEGIKKAYNISKKQKKFMNGVLSVLRRNGFKTEYISHESFRIADNEHVFTSDFSYFADEYYQNSGSKIFEKVLKNVRDESHALSRMSDFTNGQTFLRFKITLPAFITNEVITEGFPGGLCRVMCYTADDIHGKYLKKSYVENWGFPPKVLFSSAERNMRGYFGRLKYTTVDLGRLKCVQFDTRSDEFTPSMMTCEGFFEYISPVIGRRFAVCIPSEDNFAAFSDPTDDELKKISAVNRKEYLNSSAPLSSSIFVFTPQGMEVLP